jgi:hypothetical protein
MAATRTVVASMVFAAVTLAGCSGGAETTAAGPEPTAAASPDEGASEVISSNELTNGEPTTFPGGEVVIVTVEPWKAPATWGSYPTPPERLNATYVKITTEVENRRDVPIEIGTMHFGHGPYSPSGQSWEWSLGWDEQRTADGPIQPGATGVEVLMYQAPPGDPGKELFMSVITPLLAGEAEIDRSDTPETYNLHVVLP